MVSIGCFLSSEEHHRVENARLFTLPDSPPPAGGVLHGGALVTLADSLGAACAVLNLPPGAGTATTTSSTTFLRGVRGDVEAVARPLHVGRTSVVVQTDLRDSRGRLAAQVTQTQAVLPARDG